MATSLTPVQICRLNVGDTDTVFPLLDDASYEYFIEKNEGSTNRASVEAAKAIVFQLSIRGDQQVDIFSIKGAAAAKEYRTALMQFIKDPSMNLAISSAAIYAGGISKSDMLANENNLDNNVVPTHRYKEIYPYQDTWHESV